MITTYLFDLDDTLIDTKIYAQIYEPILSMIKDKLSIDDEQLEQKAEELGLKKNKFKRWDSGNLCRELNLLKEYYQILEENIKVTSVLHDLVIETFQKIKSKQKIIGIVSNSMLRTIKIYLDKYELNQYIDFIFSFDDAKCLKSDKTYWQTLISKEKLQPNECLMIGDDETEDLIIPTKFGFQTFLIKAPQDFKHILNRRCPESYDSEQELYNS